MQNTSQSSYVDQYVLHVHCKKLICLPDWDLFSLNAMSKFHTPAKEIMMELQSVPFQKSFRTADSSKGSILVPNLAPSFVREFPSYKTYANSTLCTNLEKKIE